MARKRKDQDERTLPTREALLEYLRSSTRPIGKRDILRAFDVAPRDRAALRAMIRGLEEEGLIARGGKRRLAAAGTVPPVAVLDVVGVDADGDLLARLQAWPEDRPPPRIRIVEGGRRRAAPGIGDRVLARLRGAGRNAYDAEIIRVLAAGPSRVVGLYRRGDPDGRIQPTDRRIKTDFVVARVDAGDAEDGELVEAEILPGRPLGAKRARVSLRIGDPHAPGAASLVAIHTHGIPTEFPPEALSEAARARPVGPEERVDLRAVPLVTIDGADARDFDDAVHAVPDDDPDNEGGWRVLVAIADVSWYVRPGGALDRAARERGNSVYFPDRVVPMLPETLSNDLCSLRPGEDRACFAAEMRIGADGALRRHRFYRALMRSAARLTYEEVEDAHAGRGGGPAAPLRETVIAPLYGAYRALRAAREARGAIDLDLPERQVFLDDKGRIAAIRPRLRFDSHRLIEEMMIAANVAAAETLERHRAPCMYRVHDAPSADKVEALRTYLDGLGFRLPRGQVILPRHFDQLVRKAAGTPYARLVDEAVLRSQSQAVYAPENIGHFGLALRRYAHFTSPIRRYADLLVHRSLVLALGGGAGVLPAEAQAAFAVLGDHVSMTERRAMAAEREALDRLTAAYLAEQVGAEFDARITGVTRFGVFVELDETGASGLLPAARLGDEYFRHDAGRHALIGESSGTAVALGDHLRVRLEEADLITGSLGFAPARGAAAAPRRRPGARRARR